MMMMTTVIDDDDDDKISNQGSNKFIYEIMNAYKYNDIYLSVYLSISIYTYR